MSPREESLIGAQLRGFPLHIHTNIKLKVNFLFQIKLVTFLTTFKNDKIFCSLPIFNYAFYSQDAELKADSPVLRITRGGEVLWGPLPGDDWTVFSPNHSTYEPLAMGSVQIREDGVGYGGLASNVVTVLRVC